MTKNHKGGANANVRASERKDKTKHSVSNSEAPKRVKVVEHVSARDPFSVVQDARRSAAAEYLRALADPRGTQPQRAPDDFRFPTAVWKTQLVKRVVVRPLPGSGSGAPNYGVLGYVNPSLTQKLQVGDTYALGSWASATTYTDPVYNNGITNDTIYGYRCTAMSVSFDCSASALVAAGSLRVLCVSGTTGSPDALSTLVGRPWGMLDNSRAAVVDPRRPDLGDRQFNWCWANTNDMTYFAPSVSHYGPVIVFELGTQEANMEFVVTVTTHYQGQPSLAQQMLMETDAACTASWDDVEDVRDAAMLQADMGGSGVPPFIPSEHAPEEEEGWGSKLLRGVSRIAKIVAPRVHRAINAGAHAMIPEIMDDFVDEDLESTNEVSATNVTTSSGSTPASRAVSRSFRK